MTKPDKYGWLPVAQAREHQGKQAWIHFANGVIGIGPVPEMHPVGDYDPEWMPTHVMPLEKPSTPESET